MRLSKLVLIIYLMLIISVPAGFPQQKDYPITAVHFTKVKVSDSFWSPRLEINHSVTVSHCFDQSEITGRINNFIFAGGIKEGRHEGYFFNDSDVYKIIQGAAYELAQHPDPELDAYLDKLISYIAAAQEEDGYLYTARTLQDEEYTPPGTKERWSNVEHGHELYCAGHLYEAAVAHYEATGKRNLLDVALKNADLIMEVFGPGKRMEPPGHQEIEIGFVKLYRLTGEEKYLRMAQFFLDQRGNAEGHELYGEYAQDHKPVVEQEEAVGHAVRATYMYSGMLDVAAMTGDERYVKAADRIWKNVIETKLYITGGIGATGGNEGFNKEYVLPNLTAYCETCASIANAMWNHRMFLTHGDGKYMDVVERLIYNGFLSGIGMSGDLFFYPNRLASTGFNTRSPWFNCACCPSNVVRFVPSIPGYAYAQKEKDIFVSLFIGSTVEMNLPENKVKITQETNYPWDGKIRITIEPENPDQVFTVHVRIPGWVRNKPVEGDLYRYLTTIRDEAVLKVNGEKISLKVKDGFADIERKWDKGDTIELELPMPVRRVLAHQNVEADRGKVALERGPLVYCAEGPDNKNGKVFNFILSDDAGLATKFRKDLLNGVTVITGKVKTVERGEDGNPVINGEQEFTAIPYYAWAHRGDEEMTVWLAREIGAVKPMPAPTIAYMSTITHSDTINENVTRRVSAINDQLEPESSNDHSMPNLNWWPTKGTEEWVQYTFKKEEEVSSVEVYWFDDTGMGQCRIPVSWRILYREDNEWKPVKAHGRYTTEKDTYNKVTFDPVKTNALRLIVQLPEGFSTGILEWIVNK